MQASDDDGKTADGWRATVTNPAGGHVSLRATEIGSAGSSVDQTVLRAYPIG